MSFTIVAALIAFLLFSYVDARRRTAQHLQYIAEKNSIATASAMTASVESCIQMCQQRCLWGSGTYRSLLWQGVAPRKSINRSRISLASTARLDLCSRVPPSECAAGASADQQRSQGH